MSELACPYLPGNDVVPSLPLARYLPPLPPGILPAWLKAHAPAGSWLLDPFGSTPLVALEAAQAGYRILVTSNNPILSFALETLAGAPSYTDFQSTLASFASVRRGDERLEKQIQSLYMTRCASCGSPVQTDAFLWQRDAEQPYARLYSCPACKDEGERAITPADLEQLAPIGTAPLARARALERISGTEADPASIEEALKTYLPRPLSVLFTLINKTEGFDLPPERKRLLTALLISACDDANTLWPHPAGRARPRQLTVPPQFRENNLWLTLEEAIDSWCYLSEPIPLTHWPNLPPETGGICLYTGRVRSIFPLPESVQPAAVMAAFPRPNQAFWTLSALWSGWLFGRDAVQHLKGALDRQHYDWYWHATALENVMASLAKHLPEQTPVFGLTSEASPALLLSVLVSAQAAGYQLNGLSMRTDQELAQMNWSLVEQAQPQKTAADWPEILWQAISGYLKDRGEPASYLSLYTAGLAALIQEHALPRGTDAIRTDLSSRLQAQLESLLRDRARFQHFGSAGRGPETGWWWLANDLEAATPLSDRVEMEAVRYIQKHRETSFAELDQTLCALFTGLLTPRHELVLACLESYAQPVDGSARLWRLNPQDATSQRHVDLDQAARLLVQIGERLKFDVVSGNPTLWKLGEQVEYSFHLGASALASRYLLARSPTPAKHRLMILPGSRSVLLALKLVRDPRLQEASKDWRFLKFRHLRKLAERSIPTADIWDEQLNNDQPNGEDAIQMRMF